MPKRSRISPAALAEVQAAFNAFADAERASEHSPDTQAMYIDRANHFVRWLTYDYDPADWIGREIKPKKRASG